MESQVRNAPGVSITHSGFEPTYKEWKAILEELVLQTYLEVSSLPIRNGKILKNLDSLISPLRFEPTYKEWKVAVYCHKFTASRLCFEPTYKEWKVALPKIDVMSVEFVSSLPIRNGK